MEGVENSKSQLNSPSTNISCLPSPTLPIAHLTKPPKAAAPLNDKSTDTEYNRATDKQVSNASPTAFLFRGPMMQLSTSTEGMYGEISENCIKILANEMVAYGLDKHSIFIDLGSGRGAPSIIVAHQHDIFASIGIEKCTQAFYNSLVNIKELLDREKNKSISEKEKLDQNFPSHSISFANEDLSVYDDFMGATHFYSFDAAMEGQLINNMVYQFMKTTTAWFYASFRSDLITTFGLLNCKLVKKIPVSMMGSGERRTIHFYLKDNWNKISEFSKTFLKTVVMKGSFNSDHFNITNSMEISKWNQPLTVCDLIRLSKASIASQERWNNSQLETNSLGILTRSQKAKLWGDKLNEHKKLFSKADKLLEEIARSKTSSGLKSARKKLLALQAQRKTQSKIYNFNTVDFPEHPKVANKDIKKRIQNQSKNGFLMPKSTIINHSIIPQQRPKSKLTCAKQRLNENQKINGTLSFNDSHSILNYINKNPKIA